MRNALDLFVHLFARLFLSGFHTSGSLHADRYFKTPLMNKRYKRTKK